MDPTRVSAPGRADADAEVPDWIAANVATRAARKGSTQQRVLVCWLRPVTASVFPSADHAGASDSLSPTW